MRMLKGRFAIQIRGAWFPLREPRALVQVYKVSPLGNPN